MDMRPRVLDASDPGTGKTRVQIELFAARRAAGGGAALVIAPKSLLRSAWEDDFKKFAPHINVSVAPADKREAAFNVPADVYVTNTDAVNWLVKPSRRKTAAALPLATVATGQTANSTCSTAAASTPWM